MLLEAGFEKEQFKQLPNREIKGITCDSRRVKRGDIFVAIGGLRHDGAHFAADARLRGAALVVSERICCEEQLLVTDARAALSSLCDAWCAHPGKEMKLIGITGTNGKTSTAAMLAWILKKAGKRVGVIGTVGATVNHARVTFENADLLANMTTPDPTELYPMLAQMRDEGVEYVVMEVTSHALSFSKVSPLWFSRAVFTNLSADHLDLHGDMESYFVEKRKLFSQCDHAIVSLSTPFGERLCEGLECPLDVVNEENLLDVKEEGIKGVSFRLLCRGDELCLTLPVPGRFSVENGALAAMTAYSLGIDGNMICEALACFPGVRGRMERVEVSGLPITAFLDYAHTPDALEKLLQTVRGFVTPAQRITLLFGCGGDRDRYKRRVMGAIASRHADLVILTSDNARGEDPQAILAEILRGIDKEKPYIVIPDRQRAIRYAVENATVGEVLVLAGKGHEEYEIKGSERLPFSEREILTDCMRERLARWKHEN